MSTSIYFGLYRADTLKFVRSMVIKFTDVASQINDSLTDEGVVVDEEDPTTWKYYMQLAGLYHSTDTMMYVRSADTLETIEFTKENLALHRATAREYYPGSQLYESLLRQYPDQAVLINGILFPVDIQTAIDSDNGTILYYDPQYVEEQEYDLVANIQDWANVFILRWYNEQFNLCDELNLAGVLGNFWTKMPGAIMNMRLAKAKTNQAHSYHIRQYLASHNNLDVYIPYLSTYQQLWLYRNINYLQRNAGKQDIFNRLVRNLLTNRGIPLIGYTLEQNSTGIEDNLKSEVELVKFDINMNIVQDGLNKVTVETLLEREDSLARDNATVRYDAEQEIDEQMAIGLYSKLPTKVLDSEVIDRSNSSVRTLTNVLLNEWLHLASSNKYRAYIQVPNPATGEYMTMSVKDALIVTAYCWMKSRDVLPDTIPVCVAYDVLRDKAPNFNTLRYMSPKRLIRDAVITAIQDMVPTMGNYISTELFYTDCATMHDQYLKQWEMYSFQEHPVGRGYCEQIVHMFYMHRMCKLTDTPTTWTQWFKDSGFDLSELSNTDLDQLCIDTVSIATGANLHTVITLGDIQRELLALMGQLSSYPLQFLRNVAYTDFNILGMVSPRVGDISAYEQAHMYVPVTNLNVRNYSAATKQLIEINNATVGPNVVYHSRSSDQWTINPYVNIVETSFKSTHYSLPVCNMGVREMGVTITKPNPGGNLSQYTNSTDPSWPSSGN